MRSSMLINLENSDLDKPIYRIISIERLIEMFESNALIFPQVKVWDDVYENFFVKSKFREINGEIFEIDDNLEEYYGQCWSLLKDSDALWRIYSPNKQGIRIKTTLKKIIKLIDYQNTYNSDSGIGITEDTFIGRVKYLSKSKMCENIQKEGIDTTNIMPNIIHSLFLKRKEFLHENEVRVIYWADNVYDSRLKENKKLVTFHINLNDFIEEISFDPRAEDSYISAYKNYLTGEYKYPANQIVKSKLYQFKPFVFNIK